MRGSSNYIINNLLLEIIMDISYNIKKINAARPFYALTSNTGQTIGYFPTKKQAEQHIAKYLQEKEIIHDINLMTQTEQNLDWELQQESGREYY